MKKMKTSVLALLLCHTVSVCGYADTNYALSMDFLSKYIWRGQNLNDRAVFQPSVSISNYGFTGTIWGSQDWTSVNHNGGNFTEFDYILDYTTAVPGIDWLSGSAGVIYYTFPHTDFAATTEVYVGLSFITVPLTPSIRIYRDVDEIRGTYYQFGIGKTFEKVVVINEGCYCGLSWGASIGYGSGEYNKGYFGTVRNGNFNDLTVTAGLPICFGKWTVKPNINYSVMLSDSVRSATDKSDNLWAGVNVSTSF